MNIRQELGSIVAAAFTACGYDGSYGTVTVSGKQFTSHYQSNGAMPAAKQYKKPPLEIAREVADILRGDGAFCLVEAAAPGFINLTLSDEFIIEKLREMAEDERLALPILPDETLVVDYGGPNLAKPLHVGHLRTAIIGQSLINLARFLGLRVIGDAHFGDWGLQMGLVICAIEDINPNAPYFNENYTGSYPEASPVTADELADLYPAASTRAKTDEEFAARAQRVTLDLQNGRRGYRALWKHVWDVSMEDLRVSYNALGVRFDYWYGESDADAFIPEVMERLRAKNLLRESEGAVVVDVERESDREPMPPMIVTKSNGADIYGTTDLGTLVQRMRDWNPDMVWYVVDNRQSLHFKQVFRCAELAGIIGADKCEHISYGTMNGKDGKPFKTRAGGVMRLSDLIETVTSNAMVKIYESSVIDNDEEKTEAARKIGIAALKIGDLVNHRAKDYVFDMDRFLSSEGKTGPYLQYTAVRIASVLKKAGETGDELLPPASEVERDVMLRLLESGEGLLRAFADRAPSAVCETLFEIAGAFNRFYFENKILSQPDENRRGSWLSLLSLTGRTIRIMLDILGIEVPERM